MAISASVLARAPRRRVAPGELRGLVLCALLLYAVGWLATHTRHTALAAVIYASGISVATVAAWLSRGRDQDDPPGGHEPDDHPPTRDPDGVPRFDWASFERDFASGSSDRGSRPGDR